MYCVCMCGVYVVDMWCVYVMYVVCMCDAGGYVCERCVMCVCIWQEGRVYMLMYAWCACMHMCGVPVGCVYVCAVLCVLYVLVCVL